MNTYYMIINSDCVSCGACEPQCPYGAIVAGDSQYHVDPGVCNAQHCWHDHNNPCKDVCPVNAIHVNMPFPYWDDKD